MSVEVGTSTGCPRWPTCPGNDISVDLSVGQATQGGRPYQMVQTIRRRLGEQGECASWASLRAILDGQQRVTATFRRKDGRTLHVRKATRAEPEQKKIFRALGTDPAPGGIRKMIV